LKILVATDGSASSRLAVKLACREAIAHEADLTILHAIGCSEMVAVPVGSKGAIPPMNFPLDSPGNLSIEKMKFEASKDRIRQAEKAIHEAKKIADEMKITARTKIFRADPSQYCFDAKQLIVKFAEENNFDMIVMGSRGRTGISRILLGSISEYVTKHSHCPVLISK
jgi:nucleotide-binding universal stress UspA family protein